jgi:hypothetical protein
VRAVFPFVFWLEARLEVNFLPGDLLQVGRLLFKTGRSLKIVR